jgi:5-methylthioadenosine/S-adenosylhomocysteine deaminase
MYAHPLTVDTLIDARWIVPVEPANVVLEDHSLAIEQGQIVALAPTAELHARYQAERHVALREHVLLPGLVNAHTHAAMTLMRGLADDKALMDWLRNYIWPVETQMVSDEFVHDGTLVACSEMLRSGVTCFNDMYFYPEAAARAAVEAGMRAAIGIIVIEMPSPYAGDARDYLAKGFAMRDALRDEPLLSFCIAPHAPYTVANSTLARVSTYSAELGLPVHIHLHETHEEVHESLTAHGVRPLERLARCGLLGPGLIAVHAVHLLDHEIELLARHGCNVVHCPTSNLKLANGIAPVARMLESGVNVGLGTDGAASNNRLDVLSEVRLAALLAKGASGNPTELPAHRALELASLGGARALGLEAQIGSLVPGKRADLVAIDLGAVELAPCYDPASHVAYAAGREHVTHVWVDGRLRLEERALVGLDAHALKLKALHWRDRIRGAAHG